MEGGDGLARNSLSDRLVDPSLSFLRKGVMQMWGKCSEDLKWEMWIDQLKLFEGMITL